MRAVTGAVLSPMGDGVRSAAVLAVVLCGSLGATTRGLAAEPAVTPRGPSFHPEGPGAGRLRVAVGASIDILPRRLVESEQRPFPFATVHVRYGLPSGCSVSARAKAIYLSNYLEVGASFSHRFGPFAVGVQNHGGVWFGALGVDGFDATGWSIVDEPGILLGLDVGTSRVSLTGELLLSFGKHTSLGDATRTIGAGSVFSGVATTLLVESFVGRSSVIHYGVGLLGAAPQYEAWIAFSDARSRIWYPRILGGYAF